MKLTLLDGTENDDFTAQFIIKSLNKIINEKNWNIDSYTLRDIEIAHCRGDFLCWVKSPGSCINSESSREIAESCIQCDLMVFLTPVTFGGYSYQLKKAVDHLIQNISPFFNKVQGETHHHKRYEKYPSLLVLGTLPKPDAEDEAIFKKLAHRNSINFYPKQYASAVFYHSQESEEISNRISTTLIEAGAN